MVELTTQINGQFIGTFRYSWNDLQAVAPQVTIRDLAILAFGSLADPSRLQLAQSMTDAINEDPNKEIKLIIDAVNLGAGRDVAIEENFDVTLTFPLYYILTPASFQVDLLGNQVNKVRHLTTGRMKPDDVEQLLNLGYEVVQKSGLSLDAFLADIEDPVAWATAPSMIINDQPITIFADGSTSPTNDGVFESHEANAIQSAEDYINQVKKEDSINQEVTPDHMVEIVPEEDPIIAQGTASEGLPLVLLIGAAVAIT